MAHKTFDDLILLIAPFMLWPTKLLSVPLSFQVLGYFSFSTWNILHFFPRLYLVDLTLSLGFDLDVSSTHKLNATTVGFYKCQMLPSSHPKETAFKDGTS